MGFLRVLLVIPDFADIRQLPSVAVSQGISVLCGYDYFILVIITAIRNIGGDSACLAQQISYQGYSET
jgi:hypothetical protein